MDIFLIAFIGVLLVGFLVGLSALLIWSDKKSKEAGIDPVKASQEKNMFLPEDYEPTFLEVKAEIIDMKCGASIYGYKAGRTQIDFIVSFKKDDGDIVEHSISEERYKEISIGQRVVLVYSDDSLFDFAEDE